MRRRDFITFVGTAAATWPLAARAQQRTMPVVGILSPTTLDADANRMNAIRLGLKDAGYVEGENVTIEYRSVENQIDRLPELADDLVRHQVAVIFTFVNGAGARATTGSGKYHYPLDDRCRARGAAAFSAHSCRHARD